jgi:hypothetical protein
MRGPNARVVSRTGAADVAETHADAGGDAWGVGGRAAPASRALVDIAW